MSLESRHIDIMTVMNTLFHAIVEKLPYDYGKLLSFNL